MVNDLLIPDFKVYTGEIIPGRRSGEVVAEAKGYSTIFKSLPAEDASVMPHVFMTGSSTVQDLHGDIMDIAALQDMCNVQDGLSIWRNHDYTVPDSWFGKLLVAPAVSQQGGIADLHLAVGCAINNADTAKTYENIVLQGAKWGCSGGFNILQWMFEGDEDDWYAPIRIMSVLALEWSVVGIPANQRSWVENGIKGLFDRAIRDEDGNNAIRLAPAIKSMYRKDFTELLKSMPGASGLRKDLEAAPARPSSPDRVTWEPLKKSFLINRNGTQKSIGIEEVQEILKNVKPAHLKMEPKEVNETVKIKAPTQAPESVTEPVASVTSIADETPVVSEEPITASEPITIANDDAPTTPPDDALKAYQLQQYNALALTLGLTGVLPSGLYSVNQEQSNEVMLKAFDVLLTTKSGKEFSKENAAFLDTIHDAYTAMRGTDQCKATVNNASEDEGSNDNDGDDDAQAQGNDVTASATVQIVKTLEPIIKSIGDIALSLKDIGGVNDAVSITRKQVDALGTAATNLQGEFELVRKGLNAAQKDLHALQNRPLGKPTTLSSRVVDTSEDSDSVASREDMLSVNDAQQAPVMTLRDAMKRTKVETRKMLDGRRLEVTVWPKGVGVGVRPALTDEQKMWMPLGARDAYAQGLEVAVPLITLSYEDEESEAEKVTV